MNTPRSQTPTGFKKLPNGGIVSTFLGNPQSILPTQQSASATNPMLQLNLPIDGLQEQVEAEQQPAVVDIPEEGNHEPLTSVVTPSVVNFTPADLRHEDGVVYIPIPKKLACLAGIATPIIIVLQAGLTGYDLYSKHKFN